MNSQITLPQPHTDGSISLEAAIAQRRSVRRYTSETPPLEAIGQLLWAAQGITDHQKKLRAAPSAGGRYPLVCYVCRADGVWKYHPESHTLTRHIGMDIRDKLVEAAWRQRFIAEAPCVFIISAIGARTVEKYGERGLTRYVPMDAGHAAQNLLLQATVLGLGGAPIGAFVDQATKEVLALPEQEEPMYIIPIGYPR